ncbi:MAG: bifunctional phosphoglucose/phosphomannose isomerase [bacterium]|nr:bifunctional phosphoglucose/phosphomannose isomerase [bacterium]
MKEAIQNFPKQFAWAPKIENEDLLHQYSKFVVAGMGGSSLGADLLKVWNPLLDLVIHRDYGLPEIAEADLSRTLVIASSYSGNTEETLSAMETATEFGLAVAVVAAGGKLLAKAKELGLPYVELPADGIQPRMATGFSIKAILALLGMDEALKEIAAVAKLNTKPSEVAGKKLAEKLVGKVPVIYTSRVNMPVAYNWKIKFNETAKIPAFANRFPELNHNEMTGFDCAPKAKPIAENFHFIFLRDSEDHPRIGKRMAVTAKLYRDRGFGVEEIEMTGGNVWEKIFSSTLLADWTAFYLAEAYGADPENVPMVEELKKLIS